MVLESNRRIRSRSGGFTLIELLVVVLILAILMAVAMPLYLNAVKESERRTCRANMQTISNANQAFKVKTRAYASDLNALVAGGDLGAAPKCPNGGTYALAAGSLSGSFKVTCTTNPDQGHGSFEPGVDSD